MILLQVYKLTISHCPVNKHQNVDCLSRLPKVATLSPEADIIYEFLYKPELWEHEPQKIKKLLNRLYRVIFRKDRKLFKKMEVANLPYINPSEKPI